MSEFKFINLRELHVTHDPVTRKATIVIEAETDVDGQRVRYTMEGAYRDQPDAIGAAMDVTQAERDLPMGPNAWRVRVAAGLPRFVVAFASDMELTHGKRERIEDGK